MIRWTEARFSRVFGDVAVISRLERLGSNPRHFSNLVQVGFPEHQLEEARQWYTKEATTAVERYAASRMAGGFFEDESLLSIFCRYFECTDWKLEGSPWFFSQQDYRRFSGVLVDPVEYHVSQLEQGLGEERWGANFLKLPYDLGMEKAKRSLWREICEREYFWKPHASYKHHRAEQLYQYLRRTVDIVEFAYQPFNYQWEKSFRHQFRASLERFEEVLERFVRRWQELRKERSKSGFNYGSFSHSAKRTGTALQKALAYLELDPATVTPQSLGQAFRRLSKQAHPDHGGAPEAFRRLSACKGVVETWLRQNGS